MGRKSSSSARSKGYRSRSLNFNSNQGSGRTLAIATVLFALALFLAPPIKNYFTQRAQISALEAQLSTDYSALEAAREELMLWQDPEYVKSQARDRLHFVMPGERQYIVTGVEEESDSSASTARVVEGLPEGQPWYTRLVASISEAGKNER